MATRKLLAWLDSKGVGAPSAPDAILLDWWFSGNATQVPIDNSEILLATLPNCSSYVVVKEGTIGTTDEIETITGGTNGSIILIKNAASITVKSGIDNIKLAGGADFYMDVSVAYSMLTLFFDGTNWLEMGRGTDVS